MNAAPSPDDWSDRLAPVDPDLLAAWRLLRPRMYLEVSDGSDPCLLSWAKANLYAQLDEMNLDELLAFEKLLPFFRHEAPYNPPAIATGFAALMAMPSTPCKFVLPFDTKNLHPVLAAIRRHVAGERAERDLPDDVDFAPSRATNAAAFGDAVILPTAKFYDVPHQVLRRLVDPEPKARIVAEVIAYGLRCERRLKLNSRTTKLLRKAMRAHAADLFFNRNLASKLQCLGLQKEIL
ncbi:hypothetical protein [Methylocella sp.]|uniref:hypothetical protein n=1 Tax=Methylocella sp. TaxID=1978226 RepID=UPI0037835AF0